MKLLESYSLNSGFKIRKHKPQELFYPVPEKYITIQTSSGMEAKNYSYWLDVIGYIAKPLKENGFSILHIGTEGHNYPLVERLIGKTSIPQINYVIRNSTIHVGNDSFAVHLAGLHGIPAVAVYGPTSAANHGPSFGENHKLIESHRDGKKPTFNPAEEFATIDLIKPEEIADSIFESLGLDNRVAEETIFIGTEYGKNYIEIIPDVVVSPESLQGQIPTIRCDYLYNEQNLVQSLAQYKCSIITDKETNIEIYKRFRKNVRAINFKVSMDTNLAYIKQLRNIGVQVRLWFDDAENKDDILFKFLDVEQPHFVEEETIDLDIPEGAEYRSFKYVLSNKKVYSSKSAWLKGESISASSAPTKIGEIDEDFLKELKYFKITVDIPED